MKTTDVVLAMLDEAYEKKTWHGPNLKQSLKGVTAKQAAWRPGAGRHNIWEVALHAAYWKYTVRRRLLGEKRGSFPLKGSNWFVRPVSVSIGDWEQDLALLEQTHQSMRAAVADLSPGDVDVAPPGSKVSNFEQISGIAAHDLYHAGQIQYLKRLAAGAGIH